MTAEKNVRNPFQGHMSSSVKLFHKKVTNIYCSHSKLVAIIISRGNLCNLALVQTFMEDFFGHNFRKFYRPIFLTNKRVTHYFNGFLIFVLNRKIWKNDAQFFFDYWQIPTSCPLSIETIMASTEAYFYIVECTTSSIKVSGFNK